MFLLSTFYIVFARAFFGYWLLTRKKNDILININYLRHVSDAFSGHSASFCSGLSSEHKYLSSVESPPANNAAEQCRFSATTGSQQSISVIRNKVCEKNIATSEPHET